MKKKTVLNFGLFLLFLLLQSCSVDESNRDCEPEFECLLKNKSKTKVTLKYKKEGELQEKIIDLAAADSKTFKRIMRVQIKAYDTSGNLKFLPLATNINYKIGVSPDVFARVKTYRLHCSPNEYFIQKIIIDTLQVVNTIQVKKIDYSCDTENDSDKEIQLKYIDQYAETSQSVTIKPEANPYKNSNTVAADILAYDKNNNPDYIRLSEGSEYKIKINPDYRITVKKIEQHPNPNDNFIKSITIDPAQ